MILPVSCLSAKCNTSQIEVSEIVQWSRDLCKESYRVSENLIYVNHMTCLFRVQLSLCIYKSNMLMAPPCHFEMRCTSSLQVITYTLCYGCLSLTIAQSWQICNAYGLCISSFRLNRNLSSLPSQHPDASLAVEQIFDVRYSSTRTTRAYCLSVWMSFLLGPWCLCAKEESSGNPPKKQDYKRFLWKKPCLLVHPCSLQACILRFNTEDCSHLSRKLLPQHPWG